MITIPKQTRERLPLAFQFRDRLPLGAQLASGLFSAINIDTLADVTATILASPNGTVSGTEVRFSVIAGTDGDVYKITLLATLTDGSVLEEDALIAMGDI